MATGYQLPMNPGLMSGRGAEGFLTPTQDHLPQLVNVLPRRVVPIVFLPGIMGSNLRMSETRQQRMRKDNNIAWRPDNKSEGVKLINSDAATRQLQLDPNQTEVDIYEPDRKPAPTGNPKESADDRHDNAKVNFNVNPGADKALLRDDAPSTASATRPMSPAPKSNSPLLQADPPTVAQPKTKEQKARQRGWGEVYFDSYHKLLEMCEDQLNTAFVNGKLNPWWKAVVGVNPSEWQASPKLPLQALTEADLRAAVQGCMFPVHAMGYNWLQSNRESGKKTARRIDDLISKYVKDGYQCEKVILVTHSMGGLVARAIIHGEMGNLEHKVLGVVHGVMPAIGAAAAYKRMRCGFEDSMFSIVPKVLGNLGSEVTAVLGNAQGGLELLPSQAYGNDWMRITHDGKILKSLPRNGDPYEEIYKLRGKWYGLLREEWLNPARDAALGAGYDQAARYLNAARDFHMAIANTYHSQSYAHYGADSQQAAWHRVSWSIDRNAKVMDIENLEIGFDTEKGTLSTRGAGSSTQLLRDVSPNVVISLLPANDPGDKTVPQHSADHQLRSGKFKGIFQQSGYEHQESYKNETALRSTIYSIVRIAQSMKWAKRVGVRA